MKPKMNLQMGQQMAMTPQLLQSIRLLQLSTLELEQEIHQALETNVMLEAEEDSDEDAPEEEAPAPAADEAVTGCDAAAPDKVEADFDWSSAESWSGGEPLDEDDEPFAARHAAPESQDVRVCALAQLQLAVRSAREARLVSTLLEAIDANGYLEQPLEAIGPATQLEPPATQDEVEQALALVQTVEPTGFGARSLSECLLLQLRALPASTPGVDLAVLIAGACLERIASGDWAEVREALQVSARDIARAVDLIRTCNPKPGELLASAAQAVVPDLIVSGAPGNWKVELNPGQLPRLRVNRTYERMLAGAGAHRALKDQLQEARWLVRGLEMRQLTLLRTGRAIFRRQSAFLERGELGMAPLTLREIAEDISMHESTVCRVTSQKWVQTPWGVYELKAFFPSQLSGAASEVSGTAVKAMIRRIVDAESAPLSDGAIAALLARAGVRVARRTVAKYREAMKIAPGKERTPLRRSGAQR
jgi:RNA polymerase sigma-54 factor